MAHWLAKANLWQIFKSVFASAIGIQTQQNRERDFQQSSPLPYIIVGVVFVILFILTLVFIVRSILP